MRKIVLTFGLIAGGLLSLMMVISMLFIDRIGYDRGEIIGYTTMVLSFLMVFFGIRSYRDSVAGGALGFGRAFSVGLLITIIACSCYTATWQVIYYKFMPNFGDKYAAHMIAKSKASGATQQQLDAKQREMESFKAMYKNPVMNVALTFIEPFPVGLVITLICAGILRRKRGVPDDGRSAASVGAAAV